MSWRKEQLVTTRGKSYQIYPFVGTDHFYSQQSLPNSRNKKIGGLHIFPTETPGCFLSRPINIVPVPRKEHTFREKCSSCSRWREISGLAFPEITEEAPSFYSASIVNESIVGASPFVAVSKATQRIFKGSKLTGFSWTT